MLRWEYRKIDLSNVPRRADEVDLLNMVGEQGWELIFVATNSIAIFKRKFEEPQQASPPTQAPAARRK